MASAVPLTTPFTPASNCFQPTYTLVPDSNDIYLVTSNLQGYTVATFSHGFTSSCYPSGAYGVIVDPPSGGQVFSPGWCPGGFNTASELVDGSQTTAFCCPRSASLATGESLVPQSFDCSDYIETTETPTIISSGQTSAYTVSRGEMYKVARGFAVTYAASDQAILASLTGASTSTPTSSSAAMGAAGTSAPTASSQPDSMDGLSTGAKAGIGAGVGVVALLLAVGILVFLRRRKRMRKTEPDSKAQLSGFKRVKSKFEKSELPGEGKDTAELEAPSDTTDPPELGGEAKVCSRAELHAAGVHEVDATPRPVEMYGDHIRPELPGHWNGWEAPSNAQRGP